MPSRVSGAWQPISLFVIGTVVVCPTHPHLPKLPVHNLTTPWLDSRRHKQADEELQLLARAEVCALKVYPGGHNIKLAQHSSEDVSKGGSPSVSRLDRPQYNSSGRQSTNTDDDTRLDRPRDKHSSGRRSNNLYYQLDRPLWRRCEAAPQPIW